MDSVRRRSSQCPGLSNRIEQQPSDSRGWHLWAQYVGDFSSYSNSDSDADRDPVGYTYGYGNTYGYGDTDGNSYSNTERYCEVHSVTAASPDTSAQTVTIFRRRENSSDR